VVEGEEAKKRESVQKGSKNVCAHTFLRAKDMCACCVCVSVRVCE